MKGIILLTLLSLATFCLSSPGVRLSVSQSYLNSFLQQQLPNLLPKTFFVPEISQNTTHSNFLANITSVSLTNLDLDFLNTQISMDPLTNRLFLTISNIFIYYSIYNRAAPLILKNHFCYFSKLSPL